MKIVILLVFIGFFAQSVPLQAANPPDLDGWLNSHPQIADSILWEFSPAVLAESSPPGSPPESPPPSPAGAPVESASPETPKDASPGGCDLNPGDRKVSSPSGVPEKLSFPEKKDPVVRRSIMARDERDWLKLSPEIIKKLNLDWKKLFPSEEPPSESPMKPPPQGPSVLKFDQWPEGFKQKVRDDFASMWNWLTIAWPKYQDLVNTGIRPPDFDSLFTIAEPPGYPPVDLQFGQPGSNWTVIPSDAAFDLYSKMVALSLAIEVMGILPSVTTLPPEGLKEIFDGTLWFRYVKPGPSPWNDISQEGHLVATTVIPAPSQLTFSFLAQNKLFGTSRSETVIKVLEWERSRMAHTFGGSIHPDCLVTGDEIFWGYKGGTPLSRVIQGKVMACPLWIPNPNVPEGESPIFYPELWHWTGGCGGTSGFNEQVLRVANIPAQRNALSHFRNSFLVENNAKVWIGHGDDPYSLNNSPEIPTAELLIDDATWKSWVVEFDYNDPNLSQDQKNAFSAQNDKAVGRRSNELVIKYLPKNFLKYHCWYDQGVPHDQSYIYNAQFKSSHTLSELEAIDLWGQIEAKIASLGGCYVPWP